MSKIAISLMLLNMLLDENLHKAKELSEEIERPQSVVRWHINELITAGFHIESINGRKGGYRFKKEYSRNNIYKLLQKRYYNDKEGVTWKYMKSLF
ncbi:Rrf2 family transcriptional regulator [Clostridium thailandense]|uniref:Rrf2 family transcriptional regulator n=1 Tax=Clostridium thailandense TaxID=2794346 RepID=UPI003988D359